MIIAYLAFVLALLMFCRNAGLGGEAWERHTILFCMSVPTVAFCATPLGAIVLFIMLSLVVEMIRSIAYDNQVALVAV